MMTKGELIKRQAMEIASGGISFTFEYIDSHLEALEEIAELKKKVKKCNELLKDYRKRIDDEIQEIGGCDHHVGICACGEYEILNEIDKTIKELEDI